jgi:hypothetical protein
VTGSVTEDVRRIIPKLRSAVVDEVPAATVSMWSPGSLSGAIAKSAMLEVQYPSL